MTVETATLSDAAVIEQLWQTAFEDDPDEIRSFLSHFLGKDTAFVIRDDRSIVSMLFLIEAELICGGKAQSVGYIYAGVTHPRARGRGLYRCLLQEAEAFARKVGMQAIFLQPADEILCKTYERMGFAVPLYADGLKGSRTVSETEETPLDAASYADTRRAMLMNGKRAFIDWPLRVYQHVSLWSRCIAVSDDVLALVSEDGTLLERVGAMMLPPLSVGRLKWLSDAPVSDTIYMGYGMD